VRDGCAAKYITLKKSFRLQSKHIFLPILTLLLMSPFLTRRVLGHAPTPLMSSLILQNQVSSGILVSLSLIPRTSVANFHDDFEDLVL
jgi:hypothetical protein